MASSDVAYSPAKLHMHTQVQAPKLSVFFPVCTLEKNQVTFIMAKLGSELYALVVGELGSY
jgi:hypothetical protein